MKVDVKHMAWGYAGALVVMTIWGTTFVSSKVLLGHGLSPSSIFFYRFAMAYVAMSFLSHSRLWATSWVDELTLAGLGVVGGSLYFLLENMALVYSTASNVGILVSTTPLWTAVLLSLLYRDERPSRRQALGSLVAFGGAAIVVANGRWVLHLHPLGDVLALSAALTWGLYSLGMRRVMARYSASFITRKVFAYGLLTIVPYCLFVSPLETQWDVLSEPVVAFNLLFLGLVASLGAYLLWNGVMARLGAVRSTNFIYAQPLITMLAGALVLGERITAAAMVGVVVLICGLVMAQKESRHN